MPEPAREEPAPKKEAETRRLWELTRPEISRHVENEINHFITGTRHPGDTFHNFHHFDRVRQVSEELLDSNLVKTELEKYAASNNLHAADFSSLDLEVAFFIFALTHDLGNAFSSLDADLKGVPHQDEDGINRFEKTGAEERSRAIAAKLINHYLDGVIDDTERLNRIGQLVRHLIGSTVYQPQPSPDVPFQRLVQAIDQSLQTIPETEEEHLVTLRGLISEELFDPDGRRDFDFTNWITFAKTRFTDIFPDPEERRAVLAVLGKKTLPDFLEIDKNDSRLAVLAEHARLVKTRIS